MSDVWQSVMFRAAFAGIPLDVILTRDSFRRALVQHSYPNRDGARIQDMGAEARTCNARLIFFEARPLSDNPLDSQDHIARATRFVEAAQSIEAREFVHPLFGSFPAKVENLDITASGDARNQITIEATFIEQGLDPVPLRAEVAAQLEGGAAAVSVQADLAVAAVAELGLEEEDPELAASVTTVCASSTVEVEEWESDPDISARQVTIGLQRLSTQISDVLDDLDAASNIKRHPLYQAMSRLHYQLRRAARRARQDAPALIAVVVSASAPLRQILSDVYGAALVEANFDEVVRLNDIEEPVLIVEGTTLTVPTPQRTGAQSLGRKGGYGR